MIMMCRINQSKTHAMLIVNILVNSSLKCAAGIDAPSFEKMWMQWRCGVDFDVNL
jgi:hypothetical protein